MRHLLSIQTTLCGGSSKRRCVYTNREAFLRSANQLCVSAQRKSAKVATAKRGQIYKIAAGIQVGTDINELELFEGDNKESVAFINNYYSKAQIRSKFDENQVVKFVVNYANDDELCISTNWKTIVELELEGVVKIV